MVPEEDPPSESDVIPSSRESFRLNILRSVIAQQCLTIGWHAITESSLAALTEVLDRYLKRLSNRVASYTDLGKFL